MKLEDAIALLPKFMTLRYSDQFVGWANELLEDLSSRGIMRELRLETGLVPHDRRWIVPPAGMRSIVEIVDPQDGRTPMGWKMENGEVRIESERVFNEAVAIALSHFYGYTTGSVTVDVTDAVAEQFKGYLFVVTAGTSSGQTFVVSGNDASDSEAGTTKLYFLHVLPAALSDLKVTAAKLYAPDQYISLRYSACYAQVSTVSEELPIDDRFEQRIVVAWLRYCCERQASAYSSETVKAEGNYEKIAQSLVDELLGKPGGPIRGRRMPAIMFNSRSR